MQFAKELNTTVPILKSCNFDGNSLPQAVYEKIKANIPSNVHVERLPDNWGRVKGGLNSPGSTKSIDRPSLNKELAEAVGIMLGDGSNYANFEKGAYQIRIASNLRTERSYLLNFVRPLFESLFGTKCRILPIKKSGVIYACFDSKEMGYFFDSIGVPFGGNKSTVGIPRWVWKDDIFLISCLRGLFDTDGSIYIFSKKSPNLLRVSFKNANLQLLEDVRKALLKLGFHPGKITSRSVSITRKEDVVHFMREIGFNNLKNQERFRLFSPVV